VLKLLDNVYLAVFLYPIDVRLRKASRYTLLAFCCFSSHFLLSDPRVTGRHLAGHPQAGGTGGNDAAASPSSAKLRQSHLPGMWETPRAWGKDRGSRSTRSLFSNTCSLLTFLFFISFTPLRTRKSTTESNFFFSTCISPTNLHLPADDVNTVYASCTLHALPVYYR